MAKLNFLATLLVLSVLTMNVSAIGLGTVVSGFGNLYKIYEFVKKMGPADRPLTNYYSKQWPYHYKIKEIQFNPKGYNDIYIFLVPDKSCFSPDAYTNYASQIHNTIMTANDYGLNFKDLMSALDKYGKEYSYNWQMSSHTIAGAGKSVLKGAGTKAPYLCWEQYKWTYVTMGPVKDYLIDTSILQSWHEQNTKARGNTPLC